MPVIFDQWGQPMMISPQRHDFDLDYGTARSVTASLAQELRADREARLMAEEPAEEETVSPAARRLACTAARSEGHAEGYREGRKLGAAAEGKRFMAIVKACTGARLIAALDMALEFPDIIPSACIDMAGRHFTYRGRGSASLAMRDQFPDSLALAKAQLPGA